MKPGESTPLLRAEVEKQLSEAKAALASLTESVKSLEEQDPQSQALVIFRQHVKALSGKILKLERLRDRLDAAEQESLVGQLLADREAIELTDVPPLSPGQRLLLFRPPELAETVERLRADAERLRKNASLQSQIADAIENLAAERVAEITALGYSTQIEVVAESESSIRFKASAAHNTRRQRRSPSATRGRRPTRYVITGAAAEYAHLIGATVGVRHGSTYPSWRVLIQENAPDEFEVLERRRLSGSNWSGAVVAQRIFGITYTEEEA